MQAVYEVKDSYRHSLFVSRSDRQEEYIQLVWGIGVCVEKNRWIFSHGFVEVKGDDTLRWSYYKMMHTVLPFLNFYKKKKNAAFTVIERQA